MAYTDKFVDRCPEIKPAGIKCDRVDIVELLKYTSLEEEVGATLSTLSKGPKLDYPSSSSYKSTTLNKGFFTEVQKLLSPPKKRLFQHLREELGETAYKSYWTSELGKAPDQVPNLPVGMNQETTTFGKPTKLSQEEIENTVENVIFPKKPYGVIKLESDLDLALYKRSHNHTLPGEMKDFLYDAPDDLIYGKRYAHDKSGKGARDSLRWFIQTNLCRSSQRLVKFKERTHVPIGKSLCPNKNIESVGKDHTFGIKTSANPLLLRGALRYGPINMDKIAIADYVSYISTLRNQLKKREFPPFPFFELLANFKLIDADGCSCLPLQTVYKVCNSFGLFFDNKIYEEVLKKLGIIHRENDTVSYIDFCSVLDYTKPLPNLSKIDDVPLEWKFYETTYRGTLRPSAKDDKTIRAAGVPSLRTDREAPQDGICKGETYLLVDENGIDSCIRPSIFTSYGLHPRDFLELKTKEYMKDLWTRVGVTIPDEIFELMWKEALNREENDAEKNMVCIETFRNILDEMSAAKLLELQQA